MNKNKLSFVMIIAFMLVMTLNSILAVEIYDTQSTQGIYKTSEDDSDFKIPFVRISEKRMELDSPISQTGIFCTNSSVDINSNLSGVQVFCSNDTVRINSDINYAFIFANGNVILNSIVEDTLFVYCSGTMTIGEEANVKGNIIAYCPKLEVKGNIEGNVLGSANTAYIDSVISGKLKMSVVDINFGENAKVEQGIELNTTNELLKIEDKIGTSKIDIIKVEKESFKTYAIKIVNSALSNIIIFLLILVIVKNARLDNMIQKIQGKNIIKNGIYSYIALLFIISIGIVALMAIPSFGFACIIFAAAIMIIFTLLKNIIVGTFVVKLINRKNNESDFKVNNVLAVVSTFFLLEILENIPYIGTLISFIVFIMSIGICIALIYNKSQDNKEPEIVEAK